MTDWPPKNLGAARDEARALRKVISKDEASLEAVVNAHKRAGAIIDRFRKGGVTAGEHELIDQLQRDRKALADRADRISSARDADKAARERLLKWIAQHKPSADFVVMGDSIDVAAIPRDIYGAAGYTAGFWPTWSQIQAGPWKGKLPIAIRPGTAGRCVDVEAGDFTIAEGAASSAAVKYCSISNLAALWNATAHPEDDLYWTAHYLDHEHVCDEHCGFGVTAEMAKRIVGTQWTSQGLGRSLDLSRVKPAIFGR